MILSDRSASPNAWVADTTPRASGSGPVYVAAAPVAPASPAKSFRRFLPRVISTLAEDAGAEPARDDQADSLHHDSAPSRQGQAESRSGKEGHDASGTAARPAPLRLTQQELDAARQQSHEAGYEKARAELQAEETEKRQQLDRMLAALAEAPVDMGAYTGYMQSLVFTLAEAVIRHELRTCPEHLQHLVTRCVDEIRQVGHEHIRVLLNDESLSLLGSLPERFRHSISFEVDDTLDTGDLRLVMGFTEIHESVRDKLKQMAAELMESALDDTAPTVITNNNSEIGSS